MADKKIGNLKMAEELPGKGNDDRDEDRDREQQGRNVPQPSYGSAKTKDYQRTGFFTIYKPGQGYWTRLGTYLGAALLAVFTVSFLYSHARVWLNSAGVAQKNVNPIAIGICVAFLILFALFTFTLTNKPRNAEFLIATDSEMKKVNWTSRKELIGSTKIVILFMLIIAFLLFGFDVIFGYLFYFAGVLQGKPF